MSDTNPVLLMFHAVRRDKQIADRLYTKFHEVRERMRLTTEALCMFAKYKGGDLLVRDGKYFLITSVHLIAPGLTDMRPKFEYNVKPLSYKNIEGEVLIPHSDSVISDSLIGHYQEATRAEVIKASVTFEVSKQAKKFSGTL